MRAKFSYISAPSLVIFRVYGPDLLYGKKCRHKSCLSGEDLNALKHGKLNSPMKIVKNLRREKQTCFTLGAEVETDSLVFDSPFGRDV
jgi:hypothetical protein